MRSITLESVQKIGAAQSERQTSIPSCALLARGCPDVDNHRLTPSVAEEVMPREKSNRPAAIKQRLRKADKKFEDAKADVELYYQKPIDEWDFEELQRGMPRNHNGGFSGRRPKWLTPVLMAEAQSRLKTMTANELGQYAGDAIKVMVELMESSRVPMVRFQAAKYVLDQIIGLPTQRVEAKAQIEFESLLADVMVNPDGSEDAMVIDLADSEWEEEDDDDEV